MSRTLLVVDDEPALQRMLRKRAEKDGFHVIGALSLREGLRRAIEDAPDIILLDMSLPDGTGAQLLTALRAEPSTRRIPVVVWSGATEGELQEQVLRAGAIAYVNKSDLAGLKLTLRALARGSQTGVTSSGELDDDAAGPDLAVPSHGKK